MEHFVSQFGGWLGIAAAVLFGVFSFFGLFNKTAKTLKKEETETAKDVIDLLSKKVDVLEKKVEELETSVNKLTTENQTLRDVLQGRDEVTQQFYKDAYIAMGLVKHNDDISTKNGEHIAGIEKALAGIEGLLKGKQ